MDVKFGVGFGEDIGQKILDDKEEQRQNKGESTWDKRQRKLKENRRAKKEAAKTETAVKKEQGKLGKVPDEVDMKKKAALELILGS